MHNDLWIMLCQLWCLHVSWHCMVWLPNMLIPNDVSLLSLLDYHCWCNHAGNLCLSLNFAQHSWVSYSVSRTMDGSGGERMDDHVIYKDFYPLILLMRIFGGTAYQPKEPHLIRHYVHYVYCLILSILALFVTIRVTLAIIMEPLHLTTALTL